MFDESARVTKKVMSVARCALEKAQRSARMGDVLSAGGFEQEAMAPYCQAIELAASVVLFVNAKERWGKVEEVPDDVVPMSPENEKSIEECKRLLSEEAVTTLDFALRNGVVPNPVQRIGSFIEECRVFVGRDEA